MPLRNRNRGLSLALVVGVFILAAVIGWAAFAARGERDKLCDVLYSLVARSGATVGKPGTPGYAYYQEHPEELARARAQNREFLNALPCNGGQP